MDFALPAGRGPSLTWYSSIDHARSSSKRSTLAAAVASGVAVVRGAGVSAGGFGSSLPPPHAASRNAQVERGEHPASHSR